VEEALVVDLVLLLVLLGLYSIQSLNLSIYFNLNSSRLLTNLCAVPDWVHERHWSALGRCLLVFELV
jgi:hypothetical protein